MKVRVKLFAVAKDLAGGDELVVNLPSGATLDDFRRVFAAEFPALASTLPHAMWAVDAAYADDRTILNEQSDVALIPPVSGG